MFRSALRLYVTSFSGLPRPVWMLALALLVNRAGTMVLPFLTLYLVEERGLTPARAGVVLLCFGLGSVAGSFIGGKLSDRMSAVRVQELSLLLSGAGFLAISQVRSYPWLMVTMLLLSTVSEAFRPASMTATVRHAPAGLHVRALALSRLAANLGMAIGPAVGGLLAGLSYLWLFVGDGLTCWLAALLLAATLRPSGRTSPRAATPVAAAPAPVRGLDGRFVALLCITFAVALAFFQLLGTVPLHLSRDHGLEERQIGLLFSINAGLITLFEMVLVRVTEQRNPAVMLGWGALLVCSGFAMFPLGVGFGFAAAAFVVLTAGEMLSLPFSNGLVARLAEERSPGGGLTGSYMGWYGMTFSLALIFAPWIGLTVMERLGPRVLWLGIGALGPLALAASLLLARRLQPRESAG